MHWIQRRLIGLPALTSGEDWAGRGQIQWQTLLPYHLLPRWSGSLTHSSILCLLNSRLSIEKTYCCWAAFYPYLEETPLPEMISSGFPAPTGFGSSHFGSSGAQGTRKHRIGLLICKNNCCIERPKCFWIFHGN